MSHDKNTLNSPEPEKVFSPFSVGLMNHNMTHPPTTPSKKALSIINSLINRRGSTYG
jgi:hypothetical protein